MMMSGNVPVSVRRRGRGRPRVSPSSEPGPAPEQQNPQEQSKLLFEVNPPVKVPEITAEMIGGAVGVPFELVSLKLGPHWCLTEKQKAEVGALWRPVLVHYMSSKVNAIKVLTGAAIAGTLGLVGERLFVSFRQRIGVREPEKP
jgi:hypothetical protein